MTGEITLRGQVLPVGGIKEKLLAAHRYGKTDIILPAANWADLQEIPKEVPQGFNIYPVESHLEALIICGLIPANAVRRRIKPKQFSKDLYLRQVRSTVWSDKPRKRASRRSSV